MKKTNPRRPQIETKSDMRLAFERAGLVVETPVGIRKTDAWKSSRRPKKKSP